MQLTVLGSGTAAPQPDRGAPGYLLEVGGERILLECGAGTVDRLLRAGCDPRAVDRVVLSHHHLDHFGELAHLLFAARLPGNGRRRPLTVAGSTPLLAALAGLRQAYGAWLDPAPAGSGAGAYDLTLHDLDAGPLATASCRISGHPVEHITSSRAVRVEAESGTVLAFSGDTDVCDGVVAAARDADLFLVECSFPEGAKRSGHLVPSEAADLGRRAGARKLLLTHFYPDCDASEAVGVARERFGSEVEAAADGMRVAIGGAAEQEHRR